MKKIVLGFAALLIIATGNPPGQVEAATVDVLAPSCISVPESCYVIRIRDLQVGSDIYTLTFKRGRYFGPGSIYPPGTTYGALADPILAIAGSALTSGGFQKVANYPFTGFSGGFLLPVLRQPISTYSIIRTSNLYFDTVSQIWALGTGPIIQSNFLTQPSYMWGILNQTGTVSPVPLPPAAALFASGLGLLGLVRRRKKRAVAGLTGI